VCDLSRGCCHCGHWSRYRCRDVELGTDEDLGKQDQTRRIERYPGTRLVCMNLDLLCSVQEVEFRGSWSCRLASRWPCNRLYSVRVVFLCLSDHDRLDITKPSRRTDIGINFLLYSPPISSASSLPPMLLYTLYSCRPTHLNRKYELENLRPALKRSTHNYKLPTTR
jgi:hypothetical protein